MLNFLEHLKWQYNLRVRAVFGVFLKHLCVTFKKVLFPVPSLQQVWVLCLHLKGSCFPFSQLSATVRYEGALALRSFHTVPSFLLLCQTWGHLNLAAQISDLSDLSPQVSELGESGGEVRYWIGIICLRSVFLLIPLLRTLVITVWATVLVLN